MHELAHPLPLVFGGYGHRLLTVHDSVIRPFTADAHELGLHVFFDANLGAPRADEMSAQQSIAAGTVATDPPALSRSITSGIAMLGGGPIITTCLRQHLKSPDSHTAEITAGGTMLHKTIPLRGLLAELLVPQLQPTPTYTDSQSTIFCAESAAAARNSVWINRRAAVLREGVDTKEISLLKISDADNCSNYFTKPVTTAVMNRYFSYTHANRSQFSSSAPAPA